MMNRIDPTNDRKYYGCSQNGGCRGFAPPPGERRFAMTIPGRPQELGRPDRVRRRPALHVRRQRVRPPDEHRASASATWQRISPDLTEGTEPRAPGFGTITALGTTAADPNLVYAGTNSGLMWVSHNAMAAGPAT